MCVCVCVCVFQGHGYMFVFADLPLTHSFVRQQVLGEVKNYSVIHFPIKKFYNNVAHSYKLVGILHIMLSPFSLLISGDQKLAVYE